MKRGSTSFTFAHDPKLRAVPFKYDGMRQNVEREIVVIALMATLATVRGTIDNNRYRARSIIAISIDNATAASGEKWQYATSFSSIFLVPDRNSDT